MTAWWRKSDPEAAALAALAGAAWPAPLLAAIERLRDGPSSCYLVGGTVRDVLLGRPPVEPFDLATARTPEEVTARFARTLPLGARFGTVLVLLDELRIECTTFRREGEYGDARRPDAVTFTTDVRVDLARRDLTVNAIAWDPVGAELVDPHGGVRDLRARRLRAVGDPVERFREDALRPVRAARLAATLEMTLEPATRAALGAVADRASRVAVERVRAELERLMEARHPSIGFELLRESGLLGLWMPEMVEGYGVLQNRWHAWDVWDHSLMTCDAAPAAKPVVRWAALLHDVGKPRTRGEKAGEGTFYQHEVVGAELADRILERLRFPLEMRERIVHLVREHMFDYCPGWSDAALRRWLRRVGPDAVADLFDLRLADMLGNGRRPWLPGSVEAMRRRIERLLAESRALTVGDLAVNGHDVMEALGVAPGPAVGAALESLLEAVLEHPELNTRERLLARLAERRSPSSSESTNA